MSELYELYPLAWTKKEFEKERICIFGRERLLAVVSRYEDNPEEGERIAQLFFTAPKLLKALEAMMETHRFDGTDASPWGSASVRGDWLEARRLGVAAINEAKGESS